MQNMETLYLWATPVRGHPNRKAGRAKAALRGPKKPKPVCNGPDRPTSVRSLFARETVEPSLMEEKQRMMATAIGAPSNTVSDWKAIDWLTVRCRVRRLQSRIAKAIRADIHAKAKALSWLLTH